MTGRDLISASLRLIGATAPGESLAASEATDGLAALNRMISSWSTEPLLIYSRVRDSLTLVVGTQSYTMGTGGTHSVSRPVQVHEAAVRNETVSPAVEIPVAILSLAEWQAIPAKATSGEYPTGIYLEGTFPYETVNVYPKPSVAHKLITWSSKVISSISTLDTSVSLPPGYEEALIYNLALRLAPEYGRPVSAEVATVAMETKASIKRLNHRPAYMVPDAIPASGAGGARFDVNTGGFT